MLLKKANPKSKSHYYENGASPIVEAPLVEVWGRGINTRHGSETGVFILRRVGFSGGGMKGELSNEDF
jgi:hypothetical protein